MKWLAPETLQDKIYSLKTDVWSYGSLLNVQKLTNFRESWVIPAIAGVLVWEIYAEGAEPYPGLTRLQTRAKIVVQNYRMEMPKVCQFLDFHLFDCKIYINICSISR